MKTCVELTTGKWPTQYRCVLLYQPTQRALAGMNKRASLGGGGWPGRPLGGLGAPPGVRPAAPALVAAAGSLAPELYFHCQLTPPHLLLPAPVLRVQWTQLAGQTCGEPNKKRPLL